MWKFLNGEWVLFAPENEGGAGDGSTEGEDDSENAEGEDAPEGAEGEDDSENAEGAEGEDDSENAEGEDAPASRSRKETRTQRLANEARQEREARIRLEERLAEQERLRSSQSRQDSGERERIRAEKLALMSPEEKQAFFAAEKADRLEQQLNLQSVQMQDFRDEARYDAIAATDTVKGRAYAKYKDFVESELQKQRTQGRNPTREAILMVKLGYEQINAKPSKKLKDNKAGAAVRVAASKGKPMTARGGAGAGNKGDSLESLRQRILEREARGEAG